MLLDQPAVGIRATQLSADPGVRAEQEVILLNQNLQATMKELEAFSYSVSHDLQAPLRAITGFADALVEEYGDQIKGDGEHYLSRISANAHNMRMLINDLLSYSRLGRQQMQYSSIDMSTLARAVF